jgi:hypothetical protein
MQIKWALGARAAAAVLGGTAEAAPAPRLPDWSGIWNPAERNIFDPNALPPPAAGGIPSFLPDTSYAREYPPYNAEYEARYEATLAKTRAGIATDPSGSCWPPGFPRIMTTPYPHEYIIQPHRVTILFEANGQTRRIWTDGRGHPDALDPTFNGHSIGRWEGDTLVVDTVGLRADTLFDVTGAPHSDAIHVTERIRRRDADTMEDRITVEDPKAFTKPWTVTRTYKREPTWEIAEYVCEENNRNPPNPDGTSGFIHAGPQAGR